MSSIVFMKFESQFIKRIKTQIWVSGPCEVNNFCWFFKVSDPVSDVERDLEYLVRSTKEIIARKQILLNM